jgi:hypothetical protein
MILVKSEGCSEMVNVKSVDGMELKWNGQILLSDVVEMLEL